MAITLTTFSKKFRGSIGLLVFPHTPLELFLFLPRSNTVGKKCQNVLVPFQSPEKNSKYTPHTKHYQRAYYALFRV